MWALESFDHEPGGTHDECCGSSPTSSCSDARRGSVLSRATCRENAEKERMHEKFERSFKVTPSAVHKGGRPGDLLFLEEATAGGENVESIKEAFLDEASACYRRIEVLGRSIRFDHLGNDEESKEAILRAEREAEKLRREADLRRARKREQMARDPHRKVTLRLDNKRRFEMDSLDKAGVPMRQESFVGTKGCETVDLVDVRVLRSSCKGLVEGLNVREILDKVEHSERQVRMMSATSPSLPQDASMSATTGEAMYKTDSEVLCKTPYEERLKRVYNRRQSVRVDGIMKKLSLMRTPPGKLPFNFNIFKDEDPLDLKERLTAKHSSSQRRMTLIPQEHGRGLGVRQTSNQGRQKGSVWHRGASLSEDMRVRVKQLWALTRGVVRMLLVYFAHMRLLNASELCRLFVWQLGEWSRLRSSMHRLLRSVVLLQRTSREFLALKAKRCELMQKEWQRVEDQYLVSFFKLYAYKAMEEHQTKSDQEFLWASPHECMKRFGIQMTRSQRQGMMLPRFTKDKFDELVERAIDWRPLRIPAKERKIIINRYYMVHLYKHMESRKNLLRAVQMAVQWQREMAKFLEEFGAHTTLNLSEIGGGAEINADGHLNEFWHISEETAVELVALGAEHMLRVLPFPYKEHPANKDLHNDGFEKYCQIQKRLPDELRAALLTELDGRQTTRGEMSRAGRNGMHQQPMLKSTSAKKAQGHSKPGGKAEASRQDIDELFREFTPRLRTIIDHQAQEYRQSAAAHSGSSDEGGLTDAAAGALFATTA